MANTNNNAVETVVTTTVAANNGNASKKQAQAITETVMGHRNDRSAASKAVTDLNKKLGEALLTGGMTKEQLHAMVEAAKASVLAGLDRIEERANALRVIPRGTTGEGGIHWADVVAEVFAPGSKKGAIERNTDALKKSGRIS